MFLAIMLLIASLSLFITGPVEEAFVALVCSLILLIPVIVWQFRRHKRKSVDIENSPAEWKQAIPSVPPDSIKQGKQYPDYSNTLSFYIKSSVSTTQKDYDQLSYEESFFLIQFAEALVQINMKASDITLTRLSSGMFNVDCNFCYIGKFGLRTTTIPDRFAVKTNSGKRALRVFDSEQEAKEYMAKGNGDYIEFRPGSTSRFYMQYLIGLDIVKEIYTDDIQRCIDTIPKWIDYILFCKQN